MTRMHHSDHIRNSINNNSLHKAQEIIFQIKEIYKQYNFKGLKIIDKKEITQRNINHADAMVQWIDGPKNWAYDLKVENFLGNVSVNVDDGYTISFYDT